MGGWARASRLAPGLGADVALGLGVGLAAGLGCGVAVGLGCRLVVGLGCGLAAGLGFGWSAGAGFAGVCCCPALLAAGRGAAGVLVAACAPEAGTAF